MTKEKQCQLCSPPNFRIALLIIWHDIKEGTTQADDELFNQFEHDLFNQFLWQSESYGCLCRVDIH